jgi:hypothetical protein
MIGAAWHTFQGERLQSGANFADRPTRPVQGFVAGVDFGRPGHGRRDGNS